MNTTIFVPDIECDSCVKLIARKFASLQGIISFDVKKDAVDVEFDDSLITADNIISTIKSGSFRASLHPFERKTIKERKRHYKENPKHYDIEIKALKYTIYAFLILYGLEFIAYFGFFQAIPGFFSKYGWWLFYLNLSMATLGAATWNVTAYKAKVTCMTGMMIAMTVGMQAGMMLGAVMGATNGFFIGAMSGMLIGAAVGILAGQCCGVMGLMEGAMAGVMGGTMGPMITVMMYSDHLLVFMPFFMALNVFILAGLSYMMLEEVGEGENVKRVPLDFGTFVSAVLIVTVVLIAIMVYGPKTALLSF